MATPFTKRLAGLVAGITLIPFRQICRNGFLPLFSRCGLSLLRHPVVKGPCPARAHTAL